MKWISCLPLLLLITLHSSCAPQDRMRRSPLALAPDQSVPESPAQPVTNPPQTKPEPTPPSMPVPPPTPGPVRDGRQTMKAMGSGFNLGNLFDREGQPLGRNDIKAIIDLYARAGFRHVRIPTTWMDAFAGDHLADGSGKINTAHPRFQDLLFTINHALSKGLYVVLNTHHEHWLKKDYQPGTSDALFGKLWTNIALQFANYPKELIFEVLNEPEGRFGDFSGGASPFSPESIALTRHINSVGYEAIRRSAPGNKERIILVMPNAQGNQSLLDEVYPTADLLPGGGRDPYLAVSVHTYDPWNFCGQDGSNAQYPGAASLTANVESTAKHALKLAVGLNYGEFGVGRKNAQEERNSDPVRQYYQIMSKSVRDNGASPTLWDDRGWFGLVEKGGDQVWRFKYDLAPSALK